MDVKDLTLELPVPKKPVSIRLDAEVLDWFKGQGRGYQTKINAVLKAYMKAQKQKEKDDETD
jgi:uncharacterized protein (DUF4415 family)